MKRLIVILVLAAMLSGCSGLTASKSMTSQMVNVDVPAARVVVDAYINGTLTPETARAYLPVASATEVKYRDAATASFLAYLIDKNKQILCTAEIFGKIRAAADSSVSVAKRASTQASQPWSDAEVLKRAARHARNIEDIDLMRKGVK
jgi:hypothetical protein